MNHFEPLSYALSTKQPMLENFVSETTLSTRSIILRCSNPKRLYRVDVPLPTFVYTAGEFEKVTVVWCYELQLRGPINTLVLIAVSTKC